MMRIEYKEIPDRVVEVCLADAIEDDPEYKVLKWVMEYRKKDGRWRDQATQRIDLMKRQENSLFSDWVNWEDYVRNGVNEKKLKEHCLTIFEDGGGKKAANHSVIRIEGSPLIVKKTPCSVHSFKEETNKTTARKGSSWILDGIVCGGVAGCDCGAEFVEQVEEATVKEKATIVSLREPAYWCSVCNLVLCHRCHLVYCDGQSRKGRRGRKLDLK